MGFDRMVKKEADSLRLPTFVRQSDVLSRAVKDRIVREMVGDLYGEYLRVAALAH